jgi:hypothetical protein
LQIALLGSALAALLCAGAMLAPAPAAETAAVPVFTPDSGIGWVPDRPTGDDFLPPANGPGPIMSIKDRPYVPNGQGQPTYRIADLTNPILKPWAIDQMKKANDEVIAGKVPYITRERCWPAGVPGFTVYTRVQPIYFLQSAKQVVIINELNEQVRHIYLNVPHSAKVTPSFKRWPEQANISAEQRPPPLAPIADAKAVRCRAAANGAMGQERPFARPKVPMRRRGADCFVWRPAANCVHAGWCVGIAAV